METEEGGRLLDRGEGEALAFADDSETVGGGVAQEPSATNGNEDYGGHDACDDALAADEQIRIMRFGYVSHYKLPFTRQLRDEIRTAFPCDKIIHDDADRTEVFIVILYAVLRIATLAMFVGFLSLALHVSSQLTTSQHPELTPEWGSNLFAWLPKVASLAQAAGVITAAAVIFFLFRTGARWLVLREIEQRGEKFAHNVSQRYSDVLSRMSECATGILDRTNKLAWRRSAEIYAKAALWNARRANYIDRYSTNIAWRNRWFFLRIEFVTFFMKLALALGACYLIFANFQFGANPDLETDLLAKAVFSLLILTAAIIGWGYFFRRKGDFWTAAFTKEVKLQSSPQSHYYNMVPKIVANLVAAVQSNERSSSR